MSSVTKRKSPNVYKSCPKMISLDKWKILTPLQNLHRNVVDLGILIAAKVLKKLPKVQNIAKSGHTVNEAHRDRDKKILNCTVLTVIV